MKTNAEIALMNKLESMIHSMDKTFAEYGTYLNDEEKGKIKNLMNDARKAITQENEEQVNNSMEALQRQSRMISELIMFKGGG